MDNPLVSIIVPVDKSNRGVAATRNLALDLAKGEYIQFADSDDYLDEPASFYYGVMWNKLYKAGIIHSHSIRCNTDAEHL